MKSAKWISETRDWLERDLEFSFSKPRDALFNLATLEGERFGSASVELGLLAPYLSKEGVYQLAAGNALGWETLFSASILFQERVALIRIGEHRALYRNRQIPFAAGEIGLGLLLGQHLGAGHDGNRALEQLKGYGDAGRFDPAVVPFLNFASVLAGIANHGSVDRALLAGCGIFQPALETFLDGDQEAGLKKLADLHRVQTHETKTSLGFFAWEPFDVFPIELLILMRASAGLEEFKDDLVWSGFRNRPAQIQGRPDLRPLLAHISRLTVSS